MSRVRIPPTLRGETEGAREVEARGGTVRELLDDLTARFPALRRQLVVDVSMKLVFGDGNVAIGHCRRLCLFLVCLCITHATRTFISPAAAPYARPRAKL